MDTSILNTRNLKGGNSVLVLVATCCWEVEIGLYNWNLYQLSKEHTNRQFWFFQIFLNLVNFGSNFTGFWKFYPFIPYFAQNEIKIKGWLVYPIPRRLIFLLILEVLQNPCRVFHTEVFFCFWWTQILVKIRKQNKTKQENCTEHNFVLHMT